MPREEHRTSTRLDETIQLGVAKHRQAADVPVASTSAAKRPRPIAVIEGSAPSLSHESNAVLRDRLRIASVLLAVGYLAFFIHRLVFPLVSMPGSTLLFYCHVAILGVTSLVAIRLCTNCPHLLGHLRFAETLIFGGSAAFFSVLTYSVVVSDMVAGYMPQLSGPWLLLIFTYALLIPNRWQRAAAVIIPLALLPVGVVIFARLVSPEVAEQFATRRDFRGWVLSNLMVMSLGATVAVWGVRLIRSLRLEAFEARQMGQYQLKQPLGSGGMGQVYLAEHVMLKRPCALKLIRPEMAGDPETLARFEREVRAMARLTHWNTVEVFDYGRTEDGTFYYVMEYLPGMNLDQLVRMNGPMPAARVIHLMSQACDALAEAHAKQLVHRDIKPANIFAARRGGQSDVTKLLDFGLVRASGFTQDVWQTQEGAITGSPLFMSPEQATGDALDARTDIYSLGAVAYFLLTGRPPFDHDNAMKVILAHARDTVPPLDNHVPADVAAIVMRCLQKNPDERFQDAQQLREAWLACDAAGDWSRADAREWWRRYGCPQKRKLDAQVFQETTGLISPIVSATAG